MTAAGGRGEAERPWLSSLTHGSLHPLRSCGSDKQRPSAPFPYLCWSMESEGLAQPVQPNRHSVVSRQLWPQEAGCHFTYVFSQDPTFLRCEVHVVTGEDKLLWSLNTLGCKHLTTLKTRQTKLPAYNCA